MAAYGKRLRTTVRHEYVIPRESANWAEVRKAMSVAEDELRDKHMNPPGRDVPLSDDSIWVEGNEAEVIVYWEVQR